MSTDRPQSANLIIAGVTKAATTSLFMYLSAHPDVCPSHVKETQHFLGPRYGQPVPSVSNYYRYFSKCQERIYQMEATVGYYYGGKAVASSIKEQLPGARIMLIFREPIGRLFSFYKFLKSSLALPKDLTFADYVRKCQRLDPVERKLRKNDAYWGIEGGLYANYFEDWMEVFGPESVRVYFFDHFRQDPRVVLTDICQWLGLESSVYLDELVFSQENKSVSYRYRMLQDLALRLNWYGETFWRSHPSLKRALRRLYYSLNGIPHENELSSDIRDHLESLFEPYNARLASQLQSHGYHDLPDWLENELDQTNFESADGSDQKVSSPLTLRHSG